MRAPQVKPRRRVIVRAPVIWAGELISLLGTFWWALALLVNPHLFASSPSFAAMASVAPQLVWALAALISTLAQLACVCLELPWLRRQVTLGTVCWWAFISATVFVATPLTTGVGIYCGLAVTQALTYCSLGRWRR